MRQKLTTILAGAAVCALAALLFQPAPAYAQRAAQQDGEQRETRRVQAMRQPVQEQLQQAYECAEEEDFTCARRHLDRVRNMRDLSPFEQANLWRFYGFVYFSEDNFAEAIRAYETVLRQEDLPLGLETETRQSLVGLYYQEERFEDALRMIDTWIPLLDQPQPEPHIMKASIHFELRQYREGIQPVLTALDIARERGQEPQENWYALLNFLYYELEEYDNSMEVLRILLRNWPKKEYAITLGALYGQRGDEARQLALFESAYEAGWLDRSGELTSFASMLMQANVPFKAARVLQQGLEDGSIDSDESNWRMLAQAWQMAQDHERALAPLRRAASMASDGNLHAQLATSYQSLYRWEECADAAREALRIGNLRREDHAQITLGHCLMEQGRFGDALPAFQAAARDERSRQSAQQYINYVNAERERRQQIEESLAALRR